MVKWPVSERKDIIFFADISVLLQKIEATSFPTVNVPFRLILPSKNIFTIHHSTDVGYAREFFVQKIRGNILDSQ
jgi:hypothetical protein